jgi:hypothetical protein
MLVRAVLAAAPVIFALVAFAQTGNSPSAKPAKSAAEVKSQKTPDLTGIYKLSATEGTLPGGLKNTGSPEDISLQPSAVAIAKTRDLEEDGAKNCEPIGPFRMMAVEGNKIELLPSPGRITMLFENISLGHMRTIYLDRTHDAKLAPLRVGDSIGRWEGDTLVVDTTNFNEYTWLNGAGAPHSDALHLVERYRLVLGGKYLELKMTVEDSKTLKMPYTYARYYQRVSTEIQENVCRDDILRLN